MSGFRAIIDYLVIASLGLAALQVYLTTNKLWKRKHEPAVAESISIMGEFVGLVPVTFLTLKFVLDGQWEGAADGLIWVVGATVAVFIGTGRWVEGRRDRGFFRLLADSVRQERGEVGHLAKSFLRPSGASHILRILGRVALLDDHLDDREKTFVESFARSWGIEFRWDTVPAAPGDNPLDFLPLREDLHEYLATSPPPVQVRQLGDVLHALVSIDETVTDQESLMMAELDGMMDAYLNQEERTGLMFAVVLVPQGPDQDNAIASVLPGLTKRDIHGGQVYVAGTYHSFDFAEIVSAQYRALNFFTAVVRLADEPTASKAAPLAPSRQAPSPTVAGG
ncbi:MAG TPA: hypothetical protein VK936_12180 [Longimicrobiales bacterium]|nr:hypothetical protein [Longimicrobiales bacterium]